MVSKKEQLFEQLQTIAEFFRRYAIVGAVAVLLLTAAGTAYAAAGVPQVFYSTAEIYMRPNRSEDQYLAEGVLVSEDLTADGVEIAQSTPVLEEVIFRCGLQDWFTAESLREQIYVYAEYQSRILVVMVADVDPARAQLLAQNISESAVEHINGVMDGNWAAIADKANLPEEPEYPVLWETALQSFCFGLGVFFLLAVLYSLQDHRISSGRDVEKYLGLSLLGSIPKQQKEK